MMRHTHTILAVLATSGIAACANSQPTSLERMRSASQFERDTNRNLAALKLDGKPGRAAIEALIANGYRCGFREQLTVPAIPGATTEPIVSPAKIVCVKETRDESDVCDEAALTVVLAWRDGEASFSALFDQLDTSAVLGVESDCGALPTISPEALAARRAAEAEVSVKVAQLVAVGETARSAFRSMLVDGFQCGFDAGDRRAPELNGGIAPGMRCTRVPSETRYCYREEALFDLEWPDPELPLAELIVQLGAAKVAGMRAICGLPHIEGESSVRLAVPLAPVQG